MSLFIRDNLLNYHKEYYQNNKIKLREYANDYYQGNKDKISQKFKSKKYICPCGVCINYYSRLDHYKSRKHNKRIMLKLYFRRWYGLLS